jgi:predicted ATPase
MLKSLQLENFRAFKRADVKLSSLNFFVGPNNSGKSSIISAISLIAQNSNPAARNYSLALNGAHAQLGTFYDVVHGHSARSAITIGFEIDSCRYSYTFRYRPQRREIELVKASISDGENTFLQSGKLTSLETPSYKTSLPKVRARFFGFNAYYPLIFSNLPLGQPSAQTAARRLISKSMNSLIDHFRGFDSVGAFRVPPERTYYFSGEAHTNVGLHGQNSAQILASSSSKQRTNILSSVSQWINQSGIAKSVRVNTLTKRHFEVLVEDITGSSNNITDSGFGCSQVLPVLVGGFQLMNRSTRRGSLYVVQEPEIHLHPSAAAQLGSFFVDLAQRNIQCFVETHSENIILRVARLVAEGHLNASEVAIYWVSGNKGEHRVERLSLNRDGTFKEKWPEGFFPTRADETLQLARAASKSSAGGGK